MILAASLSLAATVSTGTIERWVPDLRIAVERETGRSFLETPRVVVQDSAELQALLLEQERRPGTVVPVDWEEQRRAAKEAVAVYSSMDATIYVVNDNVKKLFDGTSYDRELLPAYLRCTLIHELTHALQHQHSRRPSSEGAEARTVERALREGQAVLASRRVCERAAADLNDALSAGSVLSSRSPEDVEAFQYGYAARFLERVHLHSGWEGVWSVLAHPPTSRAVLLAAVEPTLMPGWRDLGALRTVADAFVATGTESRVGVAEPTSTLGALALDGFAPARVVKSEGALSFRRDGEDPAQPPRTEPGPPIHTLVNDTAGVYAFIFQVDDPQVAAAWLRERSAWKRHRRIRLVLGFGTSVDSIRSADLPGADELRLDANLLIRARQKAARYREAWGLRDGMLAVVAVRQRKERLPEIVERLDALLSAYNPVIPAPLPLDPADFGSGQPTPVGGAAAYVRERAASALRTDGPRRCGEVALSFVAGVDPAERNEVRGMAYTCFVELLDLSLADALGALPEFAPPFAAGAEHVGRLLEAGRTADAQRLLARLAPTTAEERGWHTAMTTRWEAAGRRVKGR